MGSRGRPRVFDREKALHSAMELFWTKGFEGTSMVDLTGAMGIGAPSLYAAFGSKEDLFREAVELYVSTDGADIWALIDEADTAYESIEGFLMNTAQSFSRPGKPSGCLVVLSALSATDANEAFRSELTARRNQGIAKLTRRLLRAKENGEIAPATDIGKVARFYVTVQQGMSVQARDGADKATLEEIAKAALAAWLPMTRADG